MWMLLVTAATVVLGLTWLRPPVCQPLAFSHAQHEKMACVMCHAGVESRARAGLPDIGTCVRCHATPPVKSAADIAAWNDTVQTRHIVWQRLRPVADHVYFSHRRHVDIGELQCATCHGDIATLTTPPPHALKPISMVNCLACHEEQHVLNDCARCHK
jgi:hypothetical protein